MLLILLKKVLKKNWVLFIGFIILSILLFRNPFSSNTEIPNFEPLPDSLHYVIPPLNFVKGGEFKIYREGGKPISPNAPPFYPFYLVPFFAVYPDPRMFFFANITLAFLSTFFFYLIIKVVVKDRLVQLFGIVVFTTNYIIAPYANYAMADNLFITIFLGALFVLLKKVSFKNSFLIGLMAGGVYVTKYVYVPLTFILTGLYILKILIEKKLNLRTFQYFGFLALGLGIISMILIIYVKLVSGAFFANPIASSFNIIPNLANPTLGPDEENPFSLTHFYYNFMQYIYGLMGGEMKILGQLFRVIPVLIGFPALFLLLANIIFRKFRFFNFSLFLLVYTQLLLVSLFIDVDGRYVFYTIPILILACCFFLMKVKDYLSKKMFTGFFYFLLAVYFIYHLWISLGLVKFQLKTNLGKTEFLIGYSFVKSLNEYFKSPINPGEKKPIVLTISPPYITDFYTNHNYSTLPLTRMQMFNLGYPSNPDGDMDYVWGENDYSDMLKLFQNYLDKGYPIYASNFKIDKDIYYELAWTKLVERFRLTEVHKSCYNHCNLYIITPKDKKI